MITYDDKPPNPSYFTTPLKLDYIIKFLAYIVNKVFIL